MRISRGTTSGAPPTPSVDRFAPRIMVGNALAGDTTPDQAAPFQYILDPGDGTGIEAALAAAVAGYDVYIRPGVYTRAATSSVLSIPAGVRVHGCPGGPDGLGGTIIIASVGDATHVQDVFTLGTAASLTDIQIRVPPGANGGLQGSAIINIPSISILLRNVYIDMTYTGTGQRNTVFGVWTGGSAAPGTGDVLEDVEVLLPSVESTILLYAGVVFGFFGVDSVIAGVRGPSLRGCLVRGGQAGFIFLNINESSLLDCVVDGMILSSTGSVAMLYQLDTVLASTVIGPRIVSPRVRVATTGDAANATAVGILVTNAVTQGSTVLRGWVVSDFQIVFDTGVNLVGARQGVKVRIEQGGTGQNNDWTVGPGTIAGGQIHVFVQSRTTDNTTGTAGSINDGVVTAVQARGFLTLGAFVGQGCSLDIANVSQPKINRVTIGAGCDFSGAGAGQDGIALDIGVTNTIVIGNQLTPGAGNAINDAGSTTPQIIGNITT